VIFQAYQSTPASLNIMKEIEAAYLAGFFDGEGFICLRYYIGKRMPKGIKLECGLVNTNLEILVETQTAFGGNISPMNRGVFRQNRPCYQLQFAAKQSYLFLKTLYPYLKLKRVEADIAFSFQERKDKRKFGERTEEDIAFEEEQRKLIVSLHGRKQRK